MAKHASPVPPHLYSHPHAGKTCRCLKLCEVCGLSRNDCEKYYAPLDYHDFLETIAAYQNNELKQ